MVRRLLALLPFLLFFTLLPSATSSPIVAENDLASTKAERLTQAGDPAPPPLPANCGGGATPTDYDLAVCCVNGYVYLNGSPVAGVNVTISANGESITVPSADNDPGSEQPYFTASLSNEPLNVQPGEEVTITAQANGQSKTQTFIALPGSQQIDVVLPQSDVDARWQRVDLAARDRHAMAYDAARERVVLFGGFHYPLKEDLFGRYGATNNLGDTYNLDDTWEWDGNSWIQRSPFTSPLRRYSHAMVYDAAREHVLLFGGYRNGDLDDTWVWNGETWIERTPPVSPLLDSPHAMAYDAAREQVVLFGEPKGPFREDDSSFPNNAETWEWDGMTWEQQQPMLSPSVRWAPAMTYDERRGKVVLFGGSQNYSLEGSADTWEWDGSTWTELLPLMSPPERYNHTMAYDAARERVVLFGGFSYTTYYADTWEWDGSAWIEQSPSLSPPARSSHAMVYDAGRERIVLFGGRDDNTRLADTWEWDGNEWSLRATTEQPTLRRLAALSYESNGQSLLFGGQSYGTWHSDTYRWTGNGWQQLTPANTPPARIGHRLARNAVGSQLLLFGGEGADGAYRDDTWLWNGNDWLSQSPATEISKVTPEGQNRTIDSWTLLDQFTKRSEPKVSTNQIYLPIIFGNPRATQPSARAEYALTYDEQAAVWLLFGGRNESQYLGETWQYDGTTWLLRQPTTSPSPRSGATLTYDSLRERAVLIGGQSLQGYLDEIWEWDDTDWVEVTANGTHPTARSGHEAAYDSTRQVVVIAGGQETNAALNDIWEWNGSLWRQRITSPSLRAHTNFAMTYDPQHDRLVAFGGEDEFGNLVEGTYLHEVLGTSTEALPVATINRIHPRDARHGIDTIAFQGSGADAEATDLIKGYRWQHDGQVIGTQATFTMTASAFPLGAQTITLEVQDDEGTWSPQVEQTIYIRDGEAGTGGNGS